MSEIDGGKGGIKGLLNKFIGERNKPKILNQESQPIRRPPQEVNPNDEVPSAILDMLTPALEKYVNELREISGLSLKQNTALYQATTELRKRKDHN